MDQKYNIIYADPPWEYRNKKTGGSMKSGASNKYPTLSLDELKGMPISDIREKDSVLFLWATVPLLPEAFELMKAWGYQYKTMLTWVKKGRKGLGYWYRGETEHLLFGIKGKVKAFRNSDSNYIEAKVETHSRKPHVFRQFIENTALLPDPKRVELFATEKYPGWNAWGNEIDGDIKFWEKEDAVCNASES